jgi:hypothetical protein
MLGCAVHPERAKIGAGSDLLAKPSPRRSHFIPAGRVRSKSGPGDETELRAAQGLNILSSFGRPVLGATNNGSAVHLPAPRRRWSASSILTLSPTLLSDPGYIFRIVARLPPSRLCSLFAFAFIVTEARTRRWQPVIDSPHRSVLAFYPSRYPASHESRCRTFLLSLSSSRRTRVSEINIAAW